MQTARKVFLVLAGVLMLAGMARAADRHAGYYYPEPQTSEVYVARAKPMLDVTRSMRIKFVTGMTRSLLDKPYPPQFIMFAKGDEADRMIITSVEAGTYNTLYRARALLAMLTAVARETKIFQEFGVEDYFTYFDLLRMLGFERLTITDGETFAHQVTFE